MQNPEILVSLGRDHAASLLIPTPALRVATAWTLCDSPYVRYLDRGRRSVDSRPPLVQCAELPVSLKALCRDFGLGHMF